MNYLLDELDKTIALIGVIFSLILTIWIKLVIGHPIYIMIGILCFIICTGYLIIKRFFHQSSIPSLDELRCSTQFYIMLNIIFFLLLSYSIISIYLRSDTYIRPIGYFISTALMAVIVANEILFLSSQKLHIYFAISKIIIIGLSLVCSQILIFPSILGIDSWWHQWFTLKILANEHIPDGLLYSKLPLMHLMIGMTSLVTDLSYKMATMISISFLQVICDALFVFLLGKFLISTKVGLLAALLLEISNYHLAFGYFAIPNTMAAILILPIIFILLKLRIDMPFISNLLALFIMGTLILTHTVTAMCLAILLFAFCLSFEAYIRLIHQDAGRSVTWTICILFSTGMLAYWSYISGHIITLSNLINLGFRGHSIDELSPFFSIIPLWEEIFKYLGMFLSFSLSFIGCFYMISKHFRNCNRFIITIGGIIILCIAFFSLITGKNIIAGRWYYFSQILMAIPLSLSLFLFNVILKNHLIKGLLISILVFTLTFLLILSPVANIDNRFFSPNSGVRLAFTESELHAMDTISVIWNGTMGSDKYVKYPYELQFNQEFVNIDYSFYAEDFKYLHGILILVREEILKHPFHNISGYIMLEYDIHLALHQQNISRIYDCGSASGYLQS